MKKKKKLTLPLKVRVLKCFVDKIMRHNCHCGFVCVVRRGEERRGEERRGEERRGEVLEKP